MNLFVPIATASLSWYQYVLYFAVCYQSTELSTVYIFNCVPNIMEHSPWEANIRSAS